MQACQASNPLCNPVVFMQASAAAEQPPQRAQLKREKIKGSKNDIFGTGPQKTRRQVLQASRHLTRGVHASDGLPGPKTSQCSAVAGVNAICAPLRAVSNQLCMCCCRHDEEGLPIYTTEELKVGAGGDTDKCPFDCDCCF